MNETLSVLGGALLRPLVVTQISHVAREAAGAIHATV